MPKRSEPHALDLLASLGKETRRLLFEATARVDLPAGRVLFREGDEGDAVYLVLSGSLGIYVSGVAGDDRLLNLVGSGESIGEMALISGHPRSASVVAIRDCELLRLSKDRFDDLMASRPDIVAGLMRTLVHRLRQQSAETRTVIEPRMIAFLPAQDGDDCEAVARDVARRLEARGRTVRFVTREDMTRSAKWFSRLEASSDLVFLIGNLADGVWTSRCGRQADRIFVVADSRRGPATALPQEMLAQRAQHQLLDLVLIHDDRLDRPRHTDEWTGIARANRHFHLRRGVEGDWARLTRVINGEALGLVLSGGGARAFAHLGVLRAFEEHSLPIDFIGGTSMGALVGAGLARGWNVDEITARLREAFVNRRPLSDLTLPILGVVKGGRVEKLLDDSFGDLRIGDLWQPFFCVSSNLTLAEVHVHRRGLVREALRASVALPGILPPVLHERGALVDGAAINNLPVDVMRTIHRAPVVAVDVARDRAVGPESLAAHAALPWRRRLSQLPIVSILMRAATMSSEEQNRRNGLAADLLLAPPLSGIEIRDWKAFDRAVEIGYSHAVEALSDGAERLTRRRER